jgi:UDP-2,3-diacylglucosamine pyrophosphatase LpxH
MIRTLQDDTLIVFLSDTHIGGDEGHDIFESPEELTALLEELSPHGGPVELILAGDFFDFLQIVNVPNGENRASMTISRPEYRRLVSALRDFAAGESHRVIYLPGNHDAEVWWNPSVQKTLRKEGLVDEFTLSYAARFESVPERVLYCEHGNQFDPANIIKDYEDPLDTPLGDHIVTDLIRQIVPEGRITRSFDLRDVNKVYPLATIPEWVVGRFFYDLLGRVVTYLLLPLVVGYATYWVVEYLLTLAREGSPPFSFWESYRTFPGLQVLFAEIVTDASLLVIAFGLFFLAIRGTAARAVSSLSLASPGHRQGIPSPRTQEQEIRGLLTTDRRPPMRRDLFGRDIDVFVSGHTHAPSLSEIPREDGDAAIIVNSGCWLRQLQPIHAHFRGPPVFVSKFVQTHVRVFLGDSGVRVELWEHPKPARVRLRTAERIWILGRLPAQPVEDAEPQVSASRDLRGVG